MSGSTLPVFPFLSFFRAKQLARGSFTIQNPWEAGTLVLREVQAWIGGRGCGLLLRPGPPAIGARPLTPFLFGRVPPAKTDHRKKGTLILTSLEDLEALLGLASFFLPRPMKQGAPILVLDVHQASPSWIFRRCKW